MPAAKVSARTPLGPKLVLTKGSSGLELANKIKGGYDYIGLNSVQIESGVFDGVYFHCWVEENLNRLYNLQPGKFLYIWDVLHTAGLIDKHMNVQDTFRWLHDCVTCCSPCCYKKGYRRQFGKSRRRHSQEKLWWESLQVGLPRRCLLLMSFV